MHTQQYKYSQRQLPTGGATSMVQHLRSLEKSDAISLTRGCLAVTTLFFLSGQSAYAVGSASLAYFIVHGALNLPAQWMMLSGLSMAASLGSWILLAMASKVPSGHASSGVSQLWLWGTIVQKLTGLVLAYAIYVDYKGTLVTGVVASTRGGDGGDDSKVQGGHLELRIQILAGRNLVPKDMNIFGRKTRSDPYVILYHGINKMGKTSIIYKTLNPVWENELCRSPVLPEALDYCKEIEAHVFDHDLLSEDDPMGTVYIPIPETHNSKVTGWYQVENGKGPDFCKNASGELYLSIEVRRSLTRNSMAGSFRSMPHEAEKEKLDRSSVKQGRREVLY
jgi:hypothetical protein